MAIIKNIVIFRKVEWALGKLFVHIMQALSCSSLQIDSISEVNGIETFQFPMPHILQINKCKQNKTTNNNA